MSFKVVCLSVFFVAFVAIYSVDGNFGYFHVKKKRFLKEIPFLKLISLKFAAAKSLPNGDERKCPTGIEEITLKTLDFLNFIQDNEEMQTMLNGALESLDVEKTPEITICVDPEEIREAKSLDELITTK